MTSSHINRLFGYSDSWGNEQTTRELGEGQGVVVTDNPQKNQLIVGDHSRILFWDYPTTTLGEISVTTGITATGILTYAYGPSVLDTYIVLKTTRDFLYVALVPNSVIPKSHIDIYQLPIDENSKPINTITFPFQTIGTPKPLDTLHSNQAIFGLAPTSDNQYLWVSANADNRVFRVLHCKLQYENQQDSGVKVGITSKHPTMLSFER
jgi:hypothetical protein